MPANSPRRNLSKSKLMAFRQCPRRLWLEVHRPDLAEFSDGAEARFTVGDKVGALARKLFDPDGRGTLIDPRREGYPAAIQRTQELLSGSAPIFEATFVANGGLALADVMLPVAKGSPAGWRMIEVKSSTEVKPHQLEDVAIQTYIAFQAGAQIKQVDLVHVDNTWVYQGDGNYVGFLAPVKVTNEVLRLSPEVQCWIDDAQKVAAKNTEPKRHTGSHCHTPFECPFFEHCRSAEPQPAFDARWLPRIQKKALHARIDELEPAEMRDVPDSLLNKLQRRVKSCTLSGEMFFDARGAAADLKDCKLPAVFLDFETVNLAVPRWKGTRPYQQIPFQFSAHILRRSLKLEHLEFLDLSGNDPRRPFVESLLAACGESGQVFVYNASFEKSRIEELADAFRDVRRALQALNDRVFDLLPVTRDHFYHPDQRGSWSIKRVLPCIAPELSYDLLDGISEGGAAMDAYVEATAPDIDPARKAIIEQQLLKYCGRDTEALVRLWTYLTGRQVAQVCVGFA